MMRLLASLILLCLASVAAATDRCRDVSALTRYLAQVSDYSGLPDCLQVRTDQFHTDDRLMRSQAGAYDPVTGQISLAADLDLTSVIGQSFLLHEIVHYAQFHGDTARNARCPAELEAEAYRIQAGFLRAHGEEREAFMLTLASAGLTLCEPMSMDY